MDNKKVFISTIIAIVTLIIMTFGATYAYFTVTSNKNFGTRVIEATTPDYGSVVLSTGSNLYLHLARTDMTQTAAGTSGKTYYAITDEVGTPSSDSTPISIGTAEVTGTGTFRCNYSLIVQASGTMKDALTSEGHAILTVNETDYDVYSTNFPIKITGNMTGLKEGISQNIDAQFRFINTASSQDNLKNSDITLTFTAESFRCVVTD